MAAPLKRNAFDSALWHHAPPDVFSDIKRTLSQVPFYLGDVTCMQPMPARFKRIPLIDVCLESVVESQRVLGVGRPDEYTPVETLRIEWAGGTRRYTLWLDNTYGVSSRQLCKLDGSECAGILSKSMIGEIYAAAYAHYCEQWDEQHSICARDVGARPVPRETLRAASCTHRAHNHTTADTDSDSQFTDWEYEYVDDFIDSDSPPAADRAHEHTTADTDRKFQITDWEYDHDWARIMGIGNEREAGDPPRYTHEHCQRDQAFIDELVRSPPYGAGQPGPHPHGVRRGYK